ncbi:MAG: regulatory protein RecX [Candidatus Eisenbacteria bacterium]|nr:regulatory protein RecX [Candidatus Eisenbacteria bacterium]
MKRRRSRTPQQNSLFSSDAEESQVEAARNAALRLLTRRMRTNREIQDELDSRGFSKNVVSKVSERLKSVGLINDSEYAGAFLRTSLKLRPRSYRVLRAELIKKGVSPEVVDGAIRESLESVPEVDVARGVFAKVSRRYEKLPQRERRRKFFSFLGRRGFSLAIISELMGEGEEDV